LAIDKTTAIAQIDDVLKQGSATEESVTLACAAISRLAPPGTIYVERMQKGLEVKVVGAPGSRGAKYSDILTSLHGILRALRADYIADRLQSFQELIHANLFSDFLEMAEHFLESGYKDPAAVMSGGVLEEHLRKLCGKHGVTIVSKPKLDTMNADLARINAYSKNDQKQVTAWAGLRNDAAHGSYTNYTDGEVKLMVAGIRDFIGRNPA
jgi:hypothetical protein